MNPSVTPQTPHAGKKLKEATMSKRRVPALYVLTTCVLLLVPGVVRAQQACRHDANESQAEKARRESALGAARFINTWEYRVKATDGGFLPLSDLLIRTPAQEGGRVYMADKEMFAKGEIRPGFEVRLTTDGKTYSFIITDTTDPCRYSYFSDTQAVIFEGQVIR
jgi:hypothetical protein